MPNVVAVINFKGGVGKTTTTVALAEVLSAYHSKRVLVIDLDPQTNATVMLLGEERWSELNMRGHTLARLFLDAVEEKRVFNLEQTLQVGVSNVRDVTTVDLLPSSIDLTDVQDSLASIPPGRFFSNNPVEILYRIVKFLTPAYDYVLIDCPPNLALMTLNGIRISSTYVIPAIPDILSTYGIPQIVKRVREFATSIVEVIPPAGVIFSKVEAGSKTHIMTMQRLRNTLKDAPIFDFSIPQSNHIASAAEFLRYNTLPQKYGYSQMEAYLRLAGEFIKRVDACVTPIESTPAASPASIT